MMETMSKRNYVIGVREPIGGDRSPRRYRSRSDEYPLPVVKKNGVGKSSEKERSVMKRKEAIVTVGVSMEFAVRNPGISYSDLLILIPGSRVISI